MEKYSLLYGRGKMARLGKKPLIIPEGVTIEISGEMITVKGPKGELARTMPSFLGLQVSDGKVVVENLLSEDDASNRKLAGKVGALHGLMRSLIRNMLIGVSDGYEKVLELHGTGYRGEVKESTLILKLGFTHLVETPIPSYVTVEVVRNQAIFIRGIDKEKVGDFAASVRRISPPESYKGKGIRYRGEYVRQKVGKAALGAQK